MPATRRVQLAPPGTHSTVLLEPGTKHDAPPAATSLAVAGAGHEGRKRAAEDVALPVPPPLVKRPMLMAAPIFEAAIVYTCATGCLKAAGHIGSLQLH